MPSRGFVQFLSGGILFSEEQRLETEERDLKKIIELCKKYNYGFRFGHEKYEMATTDKGERVEVNHHSEFDSGIYFLPPAEIMTVEDVEERNVNGRYNILLSNMRGNNFEKVIHTRTGNIFDFNPVDSVLPDETTK
jgi:hypothetical protein